MKNIKLIIGLITLMLIFDACDKDFLEKSPMDQVGEVDFFKSPNDLMTYMNLFYTSSSFPVVGTHASDALNYSGSSISEWLDGTRTLDGAGGMGFGRVRQINYFFDNYKRVEENHPLSSYQQYVGEAHFFRALIYFNLLIRFGDIQWYTSEVSVTSEELYKPRDPRNVVADNIIADLDQASMYLKADRTSGAGRLNKWMALALQSRIALFEGTWQKYHANTDFGVANPQPEKYFNKVIEATTQIMNSGLYDIYSTGDPNMDYYDLFRLKTYQDNKEIIFWRKFDPVLGAGETPFQRQQNHRAMYPYEHSVTKELADLYLCIDGKPIAISPLFQGHDELEDEMQNRDPRFFQTIATPDAPWRIDLEGNIEYYSHIYDNLNSGVQYGAVAGYVSRKHYDPRLINHHPLFEDTPGIIYRYAEVLLNFAEAKAELGTITQADIDVSIKKLRDRIGMPNLIISDIVVDPAWDFPNLSPVINEIRRERRIELTGEALFGNDIRRWAAAPQLVVGRRPRGFKASQISFNPYPVDENGFLDPFRTRLPNGYGFKLNRDYLDAIPVTEMVLNPNLTQNPGWE